MTIASLFAVLLAAVPNTVEISPRQLKELEALYDEMMRFVGR